MLIYEQMMNSTLHVQFITSTLDKLSITFLIDMLVHCASLLYKQKPGQYVEDGLLSIIV